MKLPRRKIQYRLYPTKKQWEKLNEVSELHRQLQNGAIQERIEAYRKFGISIGFSDQCRSLTEVRKECPEYGDLNAQSCQVTLRRVDLAFQHFFRRVREGAKKAGFPRFKSRNRFKGFGYKSHGDGFRLQTSGHHGKVRLSGVGTIQMRGRGKTVGNPVTAEVIKKGERWYLSVTLECEPVRESGRSAVGLDWGVETFATLAVSDGSFEKIENPRFLRRSLQELRVKQRALSKKKLKSKNREKARKTVVRLHEKIAHQRKDFAHQTSAKLVQSHGLISTETLNVKAMTASGGSSKKGLNREILNTAPAMLISFLRYKAEEANIPWIEIPTRQVRPSQTCSRCGKGKKKPLSERSHFCENCGLTLSRDENSARVILNWALTGVPQDGDHPAGERRLAVAMNQETPPRVTL